MSQKLPVNNFEWIEDTSQFNADFIKIIMKKVMKDIFSELMFNILDNYMNFIMIYHFYQKELKLKKNRKLVANFHDKSKYVIQIRNLKETLNPGLVFKKVHRVIKCNRNSWLKSYIDMNIDLRRKAKNDFEKYFFKLMNHAAFGKPWTM